MNTLPTTDSAPKGLSHAVDFFTDAGVTGSTENLATATISRFQYDGYITTLLDNNLHELEDLRRSVERAQRKDIADVREIDSIGAQLLRGIEGPVDYIDLTNIIRDLRLGLARRRTELA
jgi:hypothetical protein